MKPEASERGRVRTEPRAVAALVPAGYNPRTMSSEARGGLAASIERFGLVQPIVVNRRTPSKGWPPGSSETIVGGHQRLTYLVGQGAEVTDVVLVDLTRPEETALNLALNSPRLAGDFTADVGELVREVQGASAELSSALLLPGLAADVAELTASAGAEPVAEEPPPAAPPKKPTTKLGDVWQLGAHRLVCGDATKADVVELALAGARADVVFTDPPYGVAYESPSGKHEAIAGDALTRDALLGLLVPAFKLAAKHARDGAAWYVWHASTRREDFAFALKAAGLVELQYLIWAKPALVLGHADYQWAHEPCFYAAKAGHAPSWYGGPAQITVWRMAHRAAVGAAVALGPGLVLSDGTGDEVQLGRVQPKRKLRALRLGAGEQVLVSADDRRSTVWEVARDARVPEHPTQKPVALAVRALENSSRPGEHVLDLFGGAGVTLLGAEVTGRVAHLVELSPAYCDVVVDRWQRLSGQKAVRAGAPPAVPAKKARR